MSAEQVQLRLGTHCETIDLTVMPIKHQNFDVVLGMPWLTRINPAIDWTQRLLTITGTATKNEPATTLRLMNAKELKRCVAKSQVEYIYLLRHAQRTNDGQREDASNSTTEIEKIHSETLTSGRQSLWEIRWKSI